VLNTIAVMLATIVASTIVLAARVLTTKMLASNLALPHFGNIEHFLCKIRTPELQVRERDPAAIGRI